MTVDVEALSDVFKETIGFIANTNRMEENAKWRARRIVHIQNQYEALINAMHTDYSLRERNRCRYIHRQN